ncbi:FAD-binding oxidoreductase [Saccharothrix sp. BKS2]|uniref:FAD-binding oxidoreductase n=1 Tax=Saccharothrix sp. BKS2 TaxID=3064400 RepID=UPI0039E843A1
MTATTSSPARTVANALRAVVRCPVLIPGGPDYDRGRRVWNGLVDRYPAAVVRCADAADVADAVRVARDHGAPLSVRGGGHDWGGRAIREGGVVLDLSAMRGVELDADGRTARVRGGSLAGGVASALAEHGLRAVTGTVNAVGIAGLTLGGGYGPLLGAHGLALDNLLGADVVLADGTAVTADAEENPDLFWALRGGGGNFGVVTGLRYRVHPIPTVLSGMAMFPLAQAPSVLRGYRELLAESPDELSVIGGFYSGPDGSPLIMLYPTWSGDPAAGEPYLRRIRALGTPVFSRLGPMTAPEQLGLLDPFVVDGRHNTATSRWLPVLTEDVCDVLVDFARRVTSPLSSLTLHHFHGAATRVPVSSTAFGLRDEHVLLEIITTWAPNSPDSGGAHREWAAALADELERSALPGGYPNLLGPDDHERAMAAFGPNTARLLEVKRRLDPDGVFTAVPALVPPVS